MGRLAASGILLLVGCASVPRQAGAGELQRSADLRIGETESLPLSDGRTVQIKLVDRR